MQRALPILVGVAIVIFLALVYVERGAIYDTLRGLKLVPIEEPVTELYFNDLDKLPQKNALVLSFSFSIHNLEGKDMLYPYTISARFANGQTLVIATSTIPVAHAATAIIPQTLRLRASGKTTIIVSLPEQNAHIEFIVR